MAFRRDSYICSFEDGGPAFDSENGEDGRHYLMWLNDRVIEFPAGCVHAKLGDKIVGQLESRIRTPELGYVNLFYLVPECRGTSLGKELHEYMERTMRYAGVSKVQLSVSPQNGRALAYYQKYGWMNLGYRDREKKVLLMELTFCTT